MFLVEICFGSNEKIAKMREVFLREWVMIVDDGLYYSRPQHLFHNAFGY